MLNAWVAKKGSLLAQLPNFTLYIELHDYYYIWNTYVFMYTHI